MADRTQQAMKKGTETQQREADHERIKTHTDTPIGKVIEIIGNSPDSYEDAMRRAVAAASESVHHITGVEARKLSAKVEDGEIVEFRVDMKIAFGVERHH